MTDLTPQQIVRELDRYIVGQDQAKRAIAIAVRNRYRWHRLSPELQAEVMPKNILMIGPTGVGKTELARRLAGLMGAPFLKVEATKFTEVGYVGRDAESIIRDLMEVAVIMVHERKQREVQAQAATLAQQRILDYLLQPHASLAGQDKANPTRRAASLRGKRDEAGSASAPESAAAPELAPERLAGAAARPALEPAHPGSLAPRTNRRALTQRKRLAEMLANNELEEQIIEIELEPDENYASMLEFIAGMSGDDAGDSFQEFLNVLPPQRKRSRQVSVREARRLLTQEEASKLIDIDQVLDQATRLAEESGVVFLDELDKVAGHKAEVGPDVSGEGVQRDLLPIVEGSTVMTRYGPVKTTHILWIAAGAFHSSKPSDLIPELQGRFPLRVELSSLSEEDFLRILTQPENALTRQYAALLAVEDVQLVFAPDGLAEIARYTRLMNERLENIGARRLYTVMERVLDDVAFAAPTLAGITVVVDRDYVRQRLRPLAENEDLSKYIL
jgi:ATP-dependent HslUV protease ATP-binding subunit HslU